MYQNRQYTNRYLFLLLTLALSAVFGLMTIEVAGANSHNASMHESEFEASLSGSNEVPPVVATTSSSTTATTGSASFKVHENEQSMTFNLQVADGEDITAAHLHCGLVGQNGPVAVGLFSNPAGVDVDGTLATGTLTASDLTSNCVGSGITTFAQLIDAMEDEKIYVNVHSIAHPNGVVRGQLIMEEVEEDDTHYKVMVMKHICNESIDSLSDFKALERGKDPVSALVATVVACPTTGLSGDVPFPGAIASPRSEYEFKVKGSSATTTQMLSDAEYKQLKLCETDVNRDADGNGSIASSTCLDISHYEFMHLKAEDGIVTVQETNAPAGTRFGTVRFTPTELAQNNDKESLERLQPKQGKITLNMSEDDDGMVMLHVYNFRTDTDDGGGNGNGNGNNVHDKIEKVKDRIKSLQDRIHGIFGR